MMINIVIKHSKFKIIHKVLVIIEIDFNLKYSFKPEIVFQES